MASAGGSRGTVVKKFWVFPADIGNEDGLSGLFLNSQFWLRCTSWLLKSILKMLLDISKGESLQERLKKPYLEVEGARQSPPQTLFCRLSHTWVEAVQGNTSGNCRVVGPSCPCWCHLLGGPRVSRNAHAVLLTHRRHRGRGVPSVESARPSPAQMGLWSQQRTREHSGTSRGYLSCEEKI